MAKLIEFQAGSLAAMHAMLREINNVRLADALQVMLGGTGDFFHGEATIIDLSGVESFPDKADWTGTVSLLRRYGLQPVAVRGAPEHLQASARKIGLAILAGEGLAALKKAETKTLAPEAPVAAMQPEAAGQPPVSAMIIERTVRSGQQIYAKGCDLVLLGAVGNGAEVIADGNIHCYGPLRGRALAGATGNKAARIFSSNFGPELISIAGIYRTFEKGIPQQIAGKPAHALLRGEKETQALVLEPLQLD